MHNDMMTNSTKKAINMNISHTFEIVSSYISIVPKIVDTNKNLLIYNLRNFEKRQQIQNIQCIRWSPLRFINF